MTDFKALFRALSEGGVECRCLTLERLIEVKRAVGRRKDLGGDRGAGSDPGPASAPRRP